MTTTEDPSDKWSTDVRIGNTSLCFKVDMGADETVISDHTYRQLFRQYQLGAPPKKLCGPAGTPLKVKGTLRLPMTAFGKLTVQEVFVQKGLKKRLLGKPTIEALGLIPQFCQLEAKASSPLQQYPLLFTRLGLLQGEYKLELQLNAKPFALTSPRQVPLPLYNKTKAALNRMEQLNVITLVEAPTEWCASMTAVPKDTGGIPICVDLTELNWYVRREWHPISAVEHSLAQ